MLRSPVRATLPPPATGDNITHSLLQMLGQPAAAAPRNQGQVRQKPHPGQLRPQPHSAAVHTGRQQSRAAQNGRHGGFVPLQVTKKTTPKKPEPGRAADRRREERGAAPAATAAEIATERQETGVETAETAGKAAETVSEGAETAPNRSQSNKPAGRGRILRRPPKNRLACKF